MIHDAQIITARAGEREFDAVVRFWFPKNGATSAKAFLEYARENMEFLFLPEIPSMASRASRASRKDAKETLFSMKSSFSQLHAIVFQKGYCTSDEAELDSWYRSAVLLPTSAAFVGVDVEKVRWIYPAKMYAQLPPPLPPKHV